MSFPASSTQISTSNLDSGSDDPSLARGDLLQCVQLVNEIIAGQNAASGACVLDGTGKIPQTQLPQSISYSGAGFQIINPASGFVEIQNLLRLFPLTKAQVTATSTATLVAGTIAYCSNVTTTTAGLVFYDGSNWKTISTSGNL